MTNETAEQSVEDNLRQQLDEALAAKEVCANECEQLRDKLAALTGEFRNHVEAAGREIQMLRQANQALDDRWSTQNKYVITIEGQLLNWQGHPNAPEGMKPSDVLDALKAYQVQLRRVKLLTDQAELERLSGI